VAPESAMACCSMMVRKSIVDDGGGEGGEGVVARPERQCSRRGVNVQLIMWSLVDINIALQPDPSDHWKVKASSLGTWGML